MPKPTGFQRRFSNARERALLGVLLGTVVFVLCLVNAATNFDWLSVVLAVLAGIALFSYLAKWLQARH